MKEHSIRKKACSVLLALVILLGVLPVFSLSALAAPPDEAAEAAPADDSSASGGQYAEAGWATVTDLLEKYSNVSRQTAPLTSNVVQNKLTAAQFVGNGILNVMSGGNTQPEARRTNPLSGQAGTGRTGQSFWIGHNDAWGGVPQGSGASYSNYDGIASFAGMELTAKGGAGGNNTSAYSMRQNIRDAQLETTLGVKNTSGGDAVVTMETWTSDGEEYYDADNNIIVTELTNTSGAPVSMQVDIWVPERIVTGDSTSADAINAYPYLSGVADGGQTLYVERQTNRLNNYSATSPENIRSNTSDYTARIAMVAGIKGGSFTEAATNGKGTATAEFSIPAEGSVQLVLYTRSSNGGTATSKKVGAMREDIKTMEENRDAALAEFGALFPSLDVGALKTQHQQWWQNYWLASYITLPEEHDVVQKYYYGAQYASGCTQRANMAHAASMWGNLLTMDNNGWGGRYFLNYNQQAQYYGVFSSNHAGAALPYAKAISGQAILSKNFAAQNGYQGIVHQRTATPFNMYKEQAAERAIASTKNVDGVAGGSRDQKSNTAFTAIPMMWYYDYTLDEDYLNDILYPFVYELMEFYMDYAVKFTAETDWPFPDATGGDPEGSGANQTYTDTSDKWVIDNEDGYIYMIDKSSVHESDHNDLSPGLDIGGSERLARFLLETAPATGASAGKVAQWQDYLDHLVDYPQKTFTKDEFDTSHTPAIPAAKRSAWGDEVTVMTAAYAITPYTDNITNNHTFVIEPYDQPVELEPIFPFESKTILEDEELVQRAIDTLDYMNSWGTSGTKNYVATTSGRGVKTGSFGSTTNGFCKIYPIAVRMGYDANEVLANFKAANSMSSGFRNSNLMATQSGGGLETIGATEAINSMFLQSDLENGTGIIRVFPNWTGQEATFTRLLAKGAFEVSSAMSATGKVSDIIITSKAGAPVSVQNPWGGSVIVKRSSGSQVKTTISGDGYINFDTVEGETYSITPYNDGLNPITAISLSPASLTLNLDEGLETGAVAATITPSDADDTTVLWYSSNNAVAMASPTDINGATCDIQAKKGGTAVITAMSADGSVQKTMNVTVRSGDVPVESVVLSEEAKTLALGGALTLSAQVYPSYLTERGVDWSSSDETVATVSTSGVLTLRKTGTATITATSKAGGSAKKKAECVVSVVPNDKALLLSTIRKAVDYTEDDFDSAGYTEFEAALDAANGVYADPDASVAAIDAAVTRLAAAMKDSTRPLPGGFVPELDMDTDDGATLTGVSVAQVVWAGTVKDDKSSPSNLTNTSRTYYRLMKKNASGTFVAADKLEGVIDRSEGMILVKQAGIYRVDALTMSIRFSSTTNHTATFTNGTVQKSMEVTFQNLEDFPRLTVSGNGSWFASSGSAAAVFNDDFDSGITSNNFEHNANDAYFGWTFPEPTVVNVFAFVPRSGANANRSYMGKLQGSNSATVSGAVWEDLYDNTAPPVQLIDGTNPVAAVAQEWHVKAVNPEDKAYRHYRWLGARVAGGTTLYNGATDTNGRSRGNMAEVALYYNRDMPPVETGPLVGALASATDLVPELYTDFEGVAGLMEEAGALLEDDNALQSALDEVRWGLVDAMDALELKLAALAGQAREFADGYGDICTTETLAVLTAALEDAEDLLSGLANHLGDATANRAGITAAYDALAAANNALEYTLASYAVEVETFLASSAAADYTTQSIAELQEALDDAKAVLQDAQATAEDIKTAHMRLYTKRNNLTLHEATNTLSGSVEIEIRAPRIGDVLTVALHGLNVDGTPVEDSDVSYTWYLNGADVGTDASYTVHAQDLRQVLSVVVSTAGADGVLTDTTDAPVAKKAYSGTVGAPVAASVTPTTISLQEPGADYEYAIRLSGHPAPTRFSAASQFEGLGPNLEYDVYQRVKETDETEASDAAMATIRTEGQPLAGTVTVTLDNTAPRVGDTLTATLAGEGAPPAIEQIFDWVVGGETHSGHGATYTVTEADLEKTIQVRAYTEQSGSDSHVESDFTAAVQKALYKGEVYAPVLESQTPTSAVLAAQEGYEYGVAAGGAVPALYQDSPVFAGLPTNTTYDFYQRVKETTGTEASEPSEKLQVTLAEEVWSGDLVGEASINNPAPKIGDALGFQLDEANIPEKFLEYEWFAGDESLGTGLTYVVQREDLGKAIVLRATCTMMDGEIISPATAPVGMDAPAAVSVAETSITLAAHTGYEYACVPAGQAPDSFAASPAFSGLSPNTEYDFYQRARVADIWYTSEKATFKTITSLTPTYLSITPEHTMLYKDTAATLTLALEPADASTHEVTWSSVDEDGTVNGTSIIELTPSGDKQSAEVTAKGSGFVTITATDGKYTATATVEVFADAISAENGYKVDVLATKVDINKAQTGGVLVPVVIGQSGDSAGAGSAGGVIAAAEPPVNNSKLITGVRLTGANADYFDVYPVDDRYVMVSAKDNTANKTYKNIGFEFAFSGGTIKSEQQNIQLVVKTAWPKITLKAEQTNTFYPTVAGGIIATSADGSTVRIKGVAPAKDNIVSVVKDGNDFTLLPLNKGSVKLDVTVELEGYKQAYKNGNVGTVAAKVVATKPKLKLSPASVTLGGTLPTKIALLSGDKKMALEDYGTIEYVKLNDAGDDLYDRDSGQIVIPAGAITSKGKCPLAVKFDGANSVSLNLTVKKIEDPAKAKISSSIKTLAVHKTHDGAIATVEIVPTVRNLDLGELTVTGLPEKGIGYEQVPGTNLIAFYVDGNQEVTASKGMKLTVSAENLEGKTAAITLKVNDRPASFKATLKGKIDIINPNSFVTATVKLANTSSTLTNVDLDSELFEAYDWNGTTFKIYTKENALPVPGKKYTMAASITLANGVDVPAKNISITPTQSKAKVSQSTKAVTLYKDTPKAGADIRLDLTSPEGVKLDLAQINATSVKNVPELFELVRNGENSWTIQLADGFDAADYTGKNKLKSSYTVKIELWAEGTYNPDDPNAPIALKEGKRASKPVLVSVKVSIK